MRRSNILLGIIGLLTMFGLASSGPSQEPQAPKAGAQDPIEVQTRGPIHEAFAQPFDVKPGPGQLIPKEPPPPIPEEPPEQKPDIAGVEWIPGYWSWDPQRQDYLWVSGVYRVPPQGRTFMPGYWQHTTDGWRWVVGFWSDGQAQPPYTPEPPAPLDNGPSMPQPDENSTYVPGAWVYRTDRFIWRPGYYAAVQPGRVWNPPRFVWTPSGYAFVDGYWDYPLEDRGLAFAPVYFRQPLWSDAGWRYQPNYVLGLDPFYDSGFVYGSSLYFGNYFDPFYARLGFNPWYQGRGRYDPVFAYHGWRNHRNNPNWVAGIQHNYAARTAGRAVAPAVVTTPLARVNHVKLTQNTAAQLQTQRTAVTQNRQLVVNRQQADAAFVSKGGTTRAFEGRSFNSSTSGGTAARITPTPTLTPRTTNSTPTFTPRPSAPSVAPRVVTPPPQTPRVATPSVQPRTIAPAPRVTTNVARPTVTNAPRVNTAPASRPHVSAPARTVPHAAPARPSAGSTRPAAGRRR